ncbi:MAG: dolichol-phosphate mannosyltransferase [Micrococcales bacterium]|nr:MAG: dolichol-phosphate mannosyltransferase [Micrococcales bacterium]PIE27411.1 MAG: dolichol-phosphate mannosyltransferase [Micrococcales bacterium]
MIPTYNERTSLPETMRRLRSAVPDADVLVIDDNSTDGTAEWADEQAGQGPAINVLHRANKQGLGKAYLAGMDWGMERGYQVLVEMDADGSHQPEQLPRLLAQVDAGADVVLGSRWVRGGSVHNWPLHRQALSRGANLYTRVLLGIRLGDPTGGFRAYTADALRTIGLDEVASQGYCFQVDMAWRAVQRGLDVREVPIAFVEREHGVSKMSKNIIGEALLSVTKWGLTHRARQVRRLPGKRRPRH